jgi:hypothetical protein
MSESVSFTEIKSELLEIAKAMPGPPTKAEIRERRRKSRIRVILKPVSRPTEEERADHAKRVREQAEMLKARISS